MSLASIIGPITSAGATRLLGTLLPLAFTLPAFFTRRDPQSPDDEREPEQRLPLFLATNRASGSTGRDPRLVTRR